MWLLTPRSSSLQLIPENTWSCFHSKLCDFLFFFSSQMFFTSWRLGAKAAATLLKQESALWYELNAWCVCVCVCVFVGRAAAAAAAVRAGYRTGTDGLWGFSWLSERLKGRLLSRGSDREHRPLSLVFVASWRPLLNQKLCLCLSTARWKHGVWKGAINFMHSPRCATEQWPPCLMLWMQWWSCCSVMDGFMQSDLSKWSV